MLFKVQKEKKIFGEKVVCVHSVDVHSMLFNPLTFFKNWESFEINLLKYLCKHSN